MNLRRLLPALAVLSLVAAPSAGAAPYEPSACRSPDSIAREVIVRYEGGTSGGARASVRNATGTGAPERVGGRSETVTILDGESVRTTIGELERRPEVEVAAPNHIAHASGFFPNDPGLGRRGDWRALQWNFTGRASVNAPDAWVLASRAGASGGRGAKVAVIDTGVAYETRGSFRRAPDLASSRFTAPYDFDSDDTHPNDANGHGTHVTGTIAQRTNNASGVTGLAYGATVIPLRALDRCGSGDAAGIARAIRYAAKRRADVINLSLEFDRRGSHAVTSAAQIPDISAAVRYAVRRGSLVVGAAGNQEQRLSRAAAETSDVAYPARIPEIVAVGATTEDACLAEYSNGGAGLDLVAPGGGADSPFDDNPSDSANCRSNGAGRDIRQQTFRKSIRTFGLPSGFEGTSMSAPHVSGIAALLVASGRIGANPSPAAIEDHLERTARDLGPAGRDDRYGAGLVDAAAALRP